MPDWNNSLFYTFLLRGAIIVKSLDAYDQVLPEGKMMIFSFETDEDYRDMNAWHNNAETSIAQLTFRNPPLAQAVMNSLPTGFVLQVGLRNYTLHRD